MIYLYHTICLRFGKGLPQFCRKALKLEAVKGAVSSPLRLM